ncbi:MAG: PhzF family phenazine biosynthesis protein [Flavobacteriaceae bacterium]|nr:PhzF family phenazine biosynthesis protein [Bacteroidia bacterium]NNF75244.1 PhzF family phenazine biosynthesis protein [Flavobacteriaceae bacterium]NNK74207.1 PhzF family phenazine biosynthesis protein [Flavobacteriaceae bacterium]
MKIPIYQVDAFTSERFGGNPAAICLLDDWLDDSVMLNIAKENNLAETAFLVPFSENQFYLRWFTPEIEMDLCGHATLASAFVIFHYLKPNYDIVHFRTKSGKLTVNRSGEYLIMDLPSRPAEPAELPKIISSALNIQPIKTFKARDYLLLYDDEQSIRNLKVDETILKSINLNPGGIIVTAQGQNADFVSRFFTPGAAVFEDPVTGSAHCSLAPFWAERLGKGKLKALQLSKRGGKLQCELMGDRVAVSGQVVPYLIGHIEV